MKKIIDAILLNFAMNYKMRMHTWKTMFGDERTDALPVFLIETEWTTNFDHMVSKWKLFANAYDDSAASIAHFWCDLDTQNKKALANWIEEHYVFNLK